MSSSHEESTRPLLPAGAGHYDDDGHSTLVPPSGATSSLSSFYEGTLRPYLVDAPRDLYLTHVHPRLPHTLRDEHNPAPRRWLAAALLFLLGFVLGLALPNTSPVPPLGSLVDPAAVHAHLSALDAIAHNSPAGNRAVGYEGYDRSVDHVVAAILADNSVTCVPTIQAFDVPLFVRKPAAPAIVLKQTAPFLLEFDSAVEVIYHVGGAARVTNGIVQLLKNPCSSDEWLWFPKGGVAVFWYRCPLDVALKLAKSANAGAVLLAWRKVPVNGAAVATAAAAVDLPEPSCSTLSAATLRSVSPIGGAVAGLLQAEAAKSIQAPVATFFVQENFLALLEAQLESGAKVRLDAVYDGEWKVAQVSNVLCDTLEGEANNTVVIGAHLDGVPFGPGIDDNGSGSSTVLTILQTLYQSGYHRRLKNRVRFAFWAAEELGGLGSEFYLANLTETSSTELNQIAAAINLDMVGAPNGWPRFGNGTTAPEAIRAGSEALSSLQQSLIVEVHCTEQRQFALEPFGGSDHVLFLAYGIPAASFATGAGNVATAQDRLRFGAVENAAADPCYHKACDGIANVDMELVKTMARTAGDLLQALGEMKNLREVLEFPLKDVQ
ncbi:hypothetical protein DFJ73DRAFT_805398 [Zopfochytrium polystomum]|nr:hypothetical protein DFJ73DRAFT_805398 [Zopfochytrium polystomum]